MKEKIIYQNERKIVYVEGDKAIKTFNSSYEISQVLNEALNQSKVAEAGINAPKVYEVKEYDNRHGIVMDYIDGDNLENIVNKNSKNEKDYISLFAKTYHDMIQNKSLNLNNSYGRIKNKIFSSELPANIKYGLFYKLRDMEFARDVIHGDFAFSNIIMAKDKKVYILDWSHVAYGAKQFDIAITYALFELQGRKDLGELYIDKMKELDGVDREQVFKVLILAYVYIVDRYDEAVRKNIYKKIYEIIKSEEA
ncbi:MAG: aminoglycoside phosphotransferase [Lachnospiraceae bacterium]|nr:aminoglycoside phosphotransferase [Lachnospiraceae bacterium]